MQHTQEIETEEQKRKDEEHYQKVLEIMKEQGKIPEFSEETEKKFSEFFRKLLFSE
jgi:hypothetical protein